MQYRWVPAVLAVLLLSLLPSAALAVGAETVGIVHRASGSPPPAAGSVFIAPDPYESVDVPAPDPVARPYDDLAWQFPTTADPQPTFPPINATHVYVAARDSTIAPPNATVFVCDGAGDEREIGDALASARGGTVELLDGTFRCQGGITLPANTTLRGQGSPNTTIEIVARPGSSGYLPIATGGEYVNLGGFLMRGNAFVMVTRSHVRVQDVRATCVDLGGTWRRASGNGMFFVWVAPPVDVVDDVEFYECHVVNAHTHGFNMNQDYRDGRCRAITNVRFLNCRASGCGYGVYGDPGIGAPVTAANQSRSEWITGFDLHEWQDLVNCEVVNCVASDNWESGFHLEPGARYDDTGESIGPRTVSRNIRFRNCVSSNNGQRNTWTGHFFMSGYYLSRDTHLENCVSENNRNCGYYVHGGADSSFDACTDDASTYGWKVCKASSDIAITNCTSANNPRWAMWLAFSQRLRVANFRHSNVGSDRGYQSILGWYKEEPQYQLPVTDSLFEITAVGNGMPIVNQAGSGNTYRLRHEGDGPDRPVAADFSATPVSGDAPFAVRFSDTSTGSTRRWWNFGDMGDGMGFGNTSLERDPVHVYAAPGNYTVTLIAANDFRYDTETRAGLISVLGPVTASFAAVPTVVPVGGAVRFTGAATGNPYTFAWDFGDGASSTEQNPTHAYARAGTYDVSLTAANPLYADTETKRALITVLERVNASFAPNRTGGPAPLAVRFTDASTGSPSSWAWDFGDGETSSEQSPVHAYAAPGTYTVRLEVANAVSSDLETRPGCIAVAPPLPSVRTLPGCSDPPTDPNADGKYEDVNGNGRADFADVVLYFNQMAWIAVNEPVAAFDCNRNGRIDFADVVWLFTSL